MSSWHSAEAFLGTGIQKFKGLVRLNTTKGSLIRRRASFSCKNRAINFCQDLFSEIITCKGHCGLWVFAEKNKSKWTLLLFSVDFTRWCRFNLPHYFFAFGNNRHFETDKKQFINLILLSTCNNGNLLTSRLSFTVSRVKRSCIIILYSWIELKNAAADASQRRPSPPNGIDQFT